MSGLYFLGIFMGILVALLYRSTLFKGEAVPFVMELPNYRLPSAKNVMQLLWEKAKDFLQKALADLRRTYEFNEILNKCFDYAMENPS